MNFYIPIFSIFLGGVSGFIYGFSFLKLINQNKEINKLPSKALRKKKLFSSILLASLRIILIGTLWYYILSSQKVSIILVLASFLVSFWIMIIKKKAA